MKMLSMGLAVTLGVALLATNRAEAQGPDYEAPAECPSAAAFGALLTARRGGPAVTSDVAARVRVFRSTDGDAVTYVGVADVNQRPGRAFVATECAALIEMLAASLAVRGERPLDAPPARLGPGDRGPRDTAGPDWGWFAAGAVTLGTVWLASISIGLGFLGGGSREREAAPAFFAPIAGMATGAALAAGSSDEDSVAAGVAGTIVQTIGAVMMVAGLAVRVGPDERAARAAPEAPRLTLGPGALRLTF